MPCKLPLLADELVIRVLTTRGQDQSYQLLYGHCIQYNCISHLIHWSLFCFAKITRNRTPHANNVACLPSLPPRSKTSSFMELQLERRQFSQLLFFQFCSFTLIFSEHLLCTRDLHGKKDYINEQNRQVSLLLALTYWCSVTITSTGSFLYMSGIKDILSTYSIFCQTFFSLRT